MGQEICYDNKDNNCNGEADEGCAALKTYYKDSDGDGYGDKDETKEDTSQPEGYVEDNTDCDDSNANIHPGATEICGDNIDNNCNGETDEAGCTPGNLSLLPDTGQTKCYNDSEEIPCPSNPEDDYYGQDGCYTINPPSYTKLDSNGNPLPDSASNWAMVKDNVTGLVWEVKTDDDSVHDKDNKYNWYDAQDVFIAQLNSSNFGGHSDWRLPTIKELASIVDYGKYKPSINTDFFPHTMWSEYWSSTPNSCYPGVAWYVLFGTGDDSNYGKPNSYYVRGVRGGQ